MRKIYISLLSFFSFFIWNTQSKAQVNLYVFSQSSGTYTAISGGTVLGVPTGNGTTALDDQVFPIPTGTFPFTFTYNGVGYTGCNVNTNGYITFGATAPSTTGYNPISATTGYAGAISAFGGDINSIFNIASLTGELRWETVGTAPNREIVIQYSKFRPAYNSSTTNAYIFDFQIRLAETTNAINIVYGGTLGFIVGTTGVSGTREIGLRGATNADFNNRLNAATLAFTSSTAGLANTSTQAYNTSVNPPGMPTLGLTYSWAPPPPCVPGSLAGGTTQSTATSACPGVNFTLSVSSASIGTGLSFLWQTSPDGLAPWTDVATATGQAYSANQTVATYYRRKMTCSGVDAFSTPLQVTMNTPTNCYCAASSTSTSFESIGGVVITGGINNVGTPATTYTNYTATQISTLYQGQAATATISKGVGSWFSTDAAYVFADFNQDGDFTDAGELVGSASGGTSPFTINFTIPPTATVGTTRLRIKFGDTGAGTIMTNSPCQVGYTYGEVEDYGLNITLPPPCTAPTALTVTAVSPTTATLSWTASSTNPSNGYQWEVRTSGAGGSGATGLVASGNTLAGVTTANAAGLTANTAYNYYVRSDCGGVFSPWAGGFAFTTPCNPITTPFTETFASYATTFPPTCWSSNNITFLVGNGANAYDATAFGSALFDFYDAPAGTNLDLTSPLFTPVPTGYRLTFDHAYATFISEVDQLEIFYSTDGGATYNSLIIYAGGTGGPLNTGGTNFFPFAPSAEQWIDKAVDLPVGTNRLLFRGTSAFGNNLYLDNIRVEQTPSCLPVTQVKAFGISPTDVMVSFTSPGSAFIVEYGPVGFTPGVDNNPGVGGTIATGIASPIPVSGLTANTTYDFYVRRVCVPGVDYSTNKKATATTLCAPTNIPYLQNFESATVPAMPSCTNSQDINGNSGSFWFNGAGGLWETYQSATQPTYVSPNKSLLYSYDPANLSRGGDDWFYIQGLNLTAGTTYRLKFFYKGVIGPTWVERLEVKYGTMAYPAFQTAGTLYTNTNIATALANPFDSAIVDFSPPSTGVYYIGFHEFALGDQGYLLIDDISVKVAPKVDVGVTGLTLPNLNCPTSGVFIQATLRNYNTTTLNFAQYPVTVTANIAGAATGAPTTTLNTGTLAAGASMTVYLNPAFNFNAGFYTIKAFTGSPDDPEVLNDTLYTTVDVHATPPAPTITPSNAQLCIGSQAQLITQFTSTIPPPVTLPAVSSGTISVPVPDASLTGATNSLLVSSIPANATITGISVSINATHTWNSDLIFNLVAPNGKVLNLIYQKGGSGDNFVNCVISSTSTAPLPSANTTPVTGTFAADAASGVGPTGYVSNVFNFAGLYGGGNGYWKLAVMDNAFLDVGTLTGWSITITYQVPNPVITWTPVTNLFTNAAATTAYVANTDAYSVYVKPSAIGTTVYTATATAASGCTSTGTASVTLNPNPVLTLGAIRDTVCISDPTLPLAAIPVGGSWSGIGVSGNSFIPPATAVGTYTLTYSYTNAFGCPGTITKKVAVKDCPERVILLRDTAIIVFPNPNNGQFNIRINSVLYSYLTMKVYTNSGILVRTQQLTGLAWGRIVPIDISNLPGGLYMVKFYYDGGVRTSEKTFRVMIGH